MSISEMPNGDVKPDVDVSGLNQHATTVSAELSQVDAITGRIEQAVAEMDALKVAAEDAAGRSEKAASRAEGAMKRAEASASRAAASAALAAARAASASRQAPIDPAGAEDKPSTLAGGQERTMG